MKKYIIPKIRAIKLDQKQAVLEVCQLAGAYFVSAGPPSDWCMRSGAGVNCVISVKGQANPVEIAWTQRGAQPS
ncbi:MAG: hypothetical protein PHQ52_00280 [Candidatus Omnitrophica bacterium]|nr:hypothetical protein [Candidatus Omnitrophota bacterium]